MKLVLVLVAMGLTACSEIGGSSNGNPDGIAYAGDPGSAYDSAANPPRTIGTVSYNPDTAPAPPNSDVPTPTPGPVAPGDLPQPGAPRTR